MTTIDYLYRKVPDYYPTMYLDGYNPYEITQAVHKNILKNYLSQEDNKMDDWTVHVKSEVHVR